MKASYKKRTILAASSAALLAVFASAPFVGCGREVPPPPPEALPPQEDEKPAEEASTETADKEIYFYTPIGKRDPFRPFHVDLAKADTAPKADGSSLPPTLLETFELEQLALVAIITGLTTPRAMVQLPDGRGIVVKPGTPIGKHGGRVARINRDNLVIEEEYIGTDGSHNVNRTIMELHETKMQ